MQKCGIRCADTAPSKIEYNNHTKTEKDEKYSSRNRQSKLLNLKLKGTVNIGWGLFTRIVSFYNDSFFTNAYKSDYNKKVISLGYYLQQ
jgi:hypothetical protein